MEGFVAAEEFGVELREFFQAFPQLLIGDDALLTVVWLGGGFEEELQDVALRQAAGQVVKGAVLLSLGTGAVGFATGGETFDVRSAQEMRRHGQSAQERGFALAQGQGRGAAELVYLSQLLGEDNQTGPVGKKKENGGQLQTDANLLNSVNTKRQSNEVRETYEIAETLVITSPNVEEALAETTRTRRNAGAAQSFEMSST